MKNLLATMGRVLWWHWPALLAWYLGSTALRDAWIHFAGWVGGYNSIVGIMLMPIATLIGLTGYVAMFLVVRDGLRQLGILAPRPEDSRERLREFGRMLLAAILPYFAFYWTWGFFRADMQAYTRIAWGIYDQEFMSAGFDENGERLISSEGRVDDFSIGPITILLFVIAYTLRWLWKKYQDRLPKWLTPFAVYLEGVWIFMAVYIIADATAFVMAWVDSRVAMVWLHDITAWLTTYLGFLVVLWNAIVWLVGQLGSIILPPLAWLAIAGVIYGQAVEAEAPKIRWRTRRMRYLQARYRRLNDGTRQRITDLFAPITDRFAGIGKSILLMWRVGPVFLSVYVLVYALWALGSAWLAILVPHLFGPHDYYSYWSYALPLIQMIPLAIMEPLRIAIVSAAYDGTLATMASQVEVVAKTDGRSVVEGVERDVEEERSGGIVGEQKT